MRLDGGLAYGHLGKHPRLFEPDGEIHIVGLMNQDFTQIEKKVNVAIAAEAVLQAITN
jgi:hypothetical protein